MQNALLSAYTGVTNFKTVLLAHSVDCSNW